MPTIVLPTETKAREWDAKLLLTAFLAHRGADSIVGSHARINNHLHRFHWADLYVSQTIVRPKRRIFRLIRQLGMHLAAWDEEGLVWATPEFYRWRRLDEENWQLVERFYCWGDVQAEAVRGKFADADAKMRITGNPRQDLYSPRMRPLYAESAEAIRRQYGEFILINSNFGSLHSPRLPFQGVEKSEEQLRQLARVSGHKPEYIAFRQRVFLSMRDLVAALAEAFPGMIIVIRPHPSERRDAWEAIAAPLPNVRVEYDHELIPWLLAARAVIHNGCTTGVETAMLGQPAMEYLAERNPEWETAIVSATSIPVCTPEEVIALLREPRQLRTRMRNVEDVLRHYLSHYNDGFACERLARDLLELASTPKPCVGFMQRCNAHLKSRIRGAEKGVTGMIRPNSSANPAYIDKKFPPTQTREVRASLEKLCQLADLPVPRAEKLHDRIWRISPARPEH